MEMRSGTTVGGRSLNLQSPGRTLGRMDLVPVLPCLEASSGAGTAGRRPPVRGR